MNPFTFFTHHRFRLHRLLGLSYLCLYVCAFHVYFADFSRFAASDLVWALPLNGVLQSVTAAYYFRFLPRKSDPGYYADRSALSYEFVQENIFFALLLLFQWIFFNDRFFVPSTVPHNPTSSRCVQAWAFLVFCPYAFRPLFPKTSFRDSLRNNDRNSSQQNRSFFRVGTWVTKIFYLWAKHFIGFFMNYVRLVGRTTRDQVEHMYLLLLFSCFATTVSMFLHTLKFKGYLSAKKAFSLYVISYLCTFYSFFQMRSVFVENADLALLALAGLICNLFSSKAHLFFQTCLFSTFCVAGPGCCNWPLM